ncbi:MAG: hypothetical protein EXS15_03965 [Phycisphaerales bacterium]|nr:hypothetical protein [Phycisphaerales bacterium]
MRSFVLCAVIGFVASCPRVLAHPQNSAVTPPVAAPLLQVVVADDNTRITQSCRLIIAPRPLFDADNNGVIQIEGDDLTIDLGGQTLFGANHETTPRHELRGIGITLRGKRITIRSGTITGFRVGISGTQCDHALLENLELVRNFSQKLGSTPDGEDATDWLRPHANDNDEWITSYGAAIAIRDSQGVIIRENGIRQGQNGIVLSRVQHSQVYNCDASFLSGWGVALWRSSFNTVCRNSLDFCVRGYSHTVYNRGQDSAGILCFEQSCDNTIMMNSATHCGDGFFGFAGSQALGDVPAPTDGEKPATADWHAGRGCNRNLIALNDFSDSAAHGLELTFSFDNRILRNRFDRNAICGVWGGYSQRTQISGNLFRDNGSAGYGNENGGINIEHGVGTVISNNQFLRNSAGVRLWWDEDAHLAQSPWAKINGVRSADNVIVDNAFTHDAIGISLRSCEDTTVGDNTMTDVALPMKLEECPHVTAPNDTARPHAQWTELMRIAEALPGGGNAVDIVDGLPVTKRSPLSGRGAILIGEYGPFDFIAPMTIAESGPAHAHRWKLLGSQTIQFLQVSKGSGDLRTNIDPENNTAIVETELPGQLSNYELAIFWGRAPNQVQRVRGTLLNANWRVAIFPLPTPTTPAGQAAGELVGQSDTPPDSIAFDQAAKRDPFVVHVESLTFPFGSGGPDAVKLMARPATIPSDHFGLRATATFLAPAGNWIVQTISDDGIRVALDGTMLIDHWDRHAPAKDRGAFTIDSPREVTMTVDYFELTGEARLDLRILPGIETAQIPAAITP